MSRTNKIERYKESKHLKKYNDTLRRLLNRFSKEDYTVAALKATEKYYRSFVRRIVF